MTDHLELRAEPYDSPAAQDLIAGVQQEYVDRYGGVDETVIDPGEFAPPRGCFLVGYRDGIAVACGGWRWLADFPETAEIKRMYVVPGHRRFGLARVMLAEIEQSMRDAGAVAAWLETGVHQPEAIALYLSAGYLPIDGYGHYRDAPLARPMGKALVDANADIAVAADLNQGPASMT